MENEPSIKKFRLFTGCLIFSGALNIALLTALIVLMLDEQKFSVSGTPPEREQREELTNEKLASFYASATFRELVSLLQERELVEEGFRKCDLALGALVSFHDFNLEKALGGAPLQRRTVKNSSFQLFPGLTDEQFLAVIRFAHQERWPFTARGLFALLKNRSREESLLQAFGLTFQFHAVQALFPKVSRDEIIEFVCRGEWSALEQFALEQEKKFDLSEERREAFLARYPLNERLLQMDFSYALKKLDDAGVIALLSQPSASVEMKNFCLALLQSPRSDAVRQRSAEILYAFEQEPMPLPFDYRAAVARFFPPALKKQEAQARGIAKQEEPAPRIAPKEREASQGVVHVVKEGETLWKIARLYRVKVEDLVALNRLEKEGRLRVGVSLKVPDRALHDGKGGSAAAAAR